MATDDGERSFDTSISKVILTGKYPEFNIIIILQQIVGLICFLILQIFNIYKSVGQRLWVFFLGFWLSYFL